MKKILAFMLGIFVVVSAMATSSMSVADKVTDKGSPPDLINADNQSTPTTPVITAIEYDGQAVVGPGDKFMPATSGLAVNATAATETTVYSGQAILGPGDKFMPATSGQLQTI